MTAYVSNQSGDWNNPLIWTPNGTPTSTDTLTIGAHTITVPTSTLFHVGAITMTGTGTGTRATISVLAGGEFRQAGLITANAYNEIKLTGAAATWDMGTFGVNAPIGGTNVNNKVTILGDFDGYAKVKGSNATYANAGAYANCFFDVRYCDFENVRFLCGGSFYAGHHFRFRDCTQTGCGLWITHLYSHPSDDWIYENIDLRQSATVDGSNRIAILSTQNPGTGGSGGTKRLQNVTVQCTNRTISAIRLMYISFDHSIIGDNIYLDYVSPVAGKKLTNSFVCIQSPIASGSGIGNAGGLISDTNYVFTYITNPHTMEGFCYDHRNGVVEAIYPVGALDAADVFPAKPSTTILLDKMLLIDGRGGVALNALASSGNGAGTMTHCTVVADIVDAAYGIVARNENSAVWTGNLDLYSNLAYIRSNTSGNPNPKAINIETAGNDQVDNMDFNAYYGFGSQAQKFFGVTSATKTIGDVGYGGNDLNGINPNFTDHNRGLVSWQSLHGGGTYQDGINTLLKINGYNSTSKTQVPAEKSGVTVADLISYVRSGYAPTNITYKDAGHDGATIGAVEYFNPLAFINPTGTDVNLVTGTTHTVVTGGMGGRTATGLKLVYTNGAQVIKTVQTGFNYTVNTSDTGTITFTATTGDLPYGTFGLSYEVTISDASLAVLDVTSFNPSAANSYVQAVSPVSDETSILYQWNTGVAATGDQIEYPDVVDGVSVTIFPDFTFELASGAFPPSIVIPIKYWDTATGIKYSVNVPITFEIVVGSNGSYTIRLGFGLGIGF